MKTLSENSGNIEDRYQRILDDKAKKDSTEPVVNQQINTSNDRLDMIKETKEEAKLAQNENFSDSSIPNETLDETIKRLKRKNKLLKHLKQLQLHLQKHKLNQKIYKRFS